MGQALIRNIDDELLDAYRDAARRAGRSLEAELRDGLKRARPGRGRDRSAMLEQLRGRIPLLPDGEDSTSVIRRYRDTHGGRWPVGDDEAD